MSASESAGVPANQESTAARVLPRAKWFTIGALAVAELLALSLWFSGSAVVPQLTSEWGLSGGEQSWMTMTVQIGFVAGALLSAVLNLSDRMPAERLIGISALLGATFNAAIPLLESGVAAALVFRFLTGVTLAGVYPPGMKLIASWSTKDRGLGIGIVVGALTLGTGAPHLINALPIFGEGGMPPWRSVLYASSAMAAAAALVALFLVRSGPHLVKIAPFNWKFAGESLRYRPTRLANFGYLGHMWELYAMWTWVPVLLIAAYEAEGWSTSAARVAGFCAIGAGGVGSVLAGKLADAFGRTRLTTISLVISGLCCVLVGFAIDVPILLTAVVMVWGFAVVADSAQFSTAVSELTDPRYVGTALTIQTSMGFLLTLFTIRMIPPLVDWIGWEWAFAPLALGPIFGIISMQQLRSLPESTRMASGNR